MPSALPKDLLLDTKAKSILTRVKESKHCTAPQPNLALVKCSNIPLSQN